MERVGNQAADKGAMEEYQPGFRFYPTEEELVSFYLHNKLEGKRPEMDRVIPVVDIYTFEPWQLPELSGELCHMDTEQWFFFTPRQEREARGGRPSRTTSSGYWKATGSPGYVYSADTTVIGVKKTMVFYRGKAPTGQKTKWKMNEYRAILKENPNGASGSAVPKLRHELSLCRVYIVSGNFRAFDRRPLMGAEGREPIAQQAREEGVNVMASCQSTGTREKTISSPESSCSGEGTSEVEVPNTNWGNLVNTSEPLWDWEQLNWP